MRQTRQRQAFVPVSPAPETGTRSFPVELAHSDAGAVIVDAATRSAGTFVTVTESTYQPVAAHPRTALHLPEPL